MKPRKFSKVICIGLPKTGTTTLGNCLEVLGYNKAPYNISLIEQYAHDPSQVDLRTELEKYEAFEDWPYPLAFRELLELEPDAAFILSFRRTSGSWLESVKKHTKRNPSERSRQLRARFFGASNPYESGDIYKLFYEKHCQEVRSHFSDNQNQLLEICWENGHGWPELCEFLGLPEPKGVDFPHANAANSAGRSTKKILSLVKQQARRFVKPR